MQGEFDEQYNCHVLDEDKLLDHISERMDSDDGGIVVDYHGCDLFPERYEDIWKCGWTDRLADIIIT